MIKRTSILQVVGEPFNIEHHGIAFPPDGPYMEIVNFAVLEIVESGEYKQLETRYFGD